MTVSVWTRGDRFPLNFNGVSDVLMFISLQVVLDVWTVPMGKGMFFFSSPSNMHWIGGYDSSLCLRLAVIMDHFEQRNSSLALLGVGCCRRLQQNVESASNSVCFTSIIDINAKGARMKHDFRWCSCSLSSSHTSHSFQTADEIRV